MTTRPVNVWAPLAPRGAAWRGPAGAGTMFGAGSGELWIWIGCSASALALATQFEGPRTSNQINEASRCRPRNMKLLSASARSQAFPIPNYRH